jgi:hypothetical protein
MPIRKYRDISDVEPAWEWQTRGDLLARIRHLWARSSYLAELTSGGLRYPRGVHKLRTIEDANRDRDRHRLAAGGSLG